MGRYWKIVFPTWHQRGEESPSSGDPWSGGLWHNPNCPGAQGWSLANNWYYRHHDDCFLSPIAGWQKYCLSVTSIASARDLFLSRKPVNIISSEIIIPEHHARNSQKQIRNGRTLTERIAIGEWERRPKSTLLCACKKMTLCRKVGVLKLIYCLWSKSFDMIKDIFEPLLRNQKDSLDILYWLQRSSYINIWILLVKRTNLQAL